jgi:hypothetical protein
VERTDFKGSSCQLGPELNPQTKRNERTIARLLGHANLRTVMRYVHLSQEHLDRSMVLYGAEPAKPERVQSGSNESATFGDSSPLSMSGSKVQ